MQTRVSLLPTLLFSSALIAQYAPPDPAGLEGIIVEKYYIADANDAADSDGGTGLTEGTVTYRVFVDLKPGYKLLTVGGFPNHPLSIGTSTTFFNNDDRGEAWGNSINDIHLDKNTVAIDSWLTMGGASDAHWGVLKATDTDGSIVGGANNDGGSTGTPLLVNNTPAMGTALTDADGLLSATTPPSITGVGTAPDLFESGGSNSYSSENYAWAILGGVLSPEASNRILIGQFTTNGVLDLCLNLFVRIPDSLVCADANCHVNMIYYADLLPADTAGTSIENDNIFTLPSLCYSSAQTVIDCEGQSGGNALPGTACDDGNADTTNDTYASTCDCLGEDCLGVPGGGALPGTPCDDGNAATTNDTWITGCQCEGASGIADGDLNGSITTAPNPTNDRTLVSLRNVAGERVQYTLVNTLGAVQRIEDLGRIQGDQRFMVDLQAMPQGLYFLRVEVGAASHVVRLVKL